MRDDDRAKILAGLEETTINPLIITNTLNTFAGTVTAAGGTGGATAGGTTGTVVFLSIAYPPAGSVIWLK